MATNSNIEDTKENTSKTTKSNDLLEQVISKELKVTAKKKERQKHTPEQFKKTVESFGSITKINDNAKAGAILLLSLQLGGVASRKGNRFSTEIEGHVVDNEDITTAIHSGCSKDTTPRAFARSFANEIFSISKNSKISGNIAKKLASKLTEDWNKIENPDKDFWASDFQSENPNCPKEIRELINKQYTMQFVTEKTKTKKG